MYNAKAKIKIFEDTQETEINNYLADNDYRQIITTSDKVIIITNMD
tara:strand:- start:853 stop:990 length:138 start_codon:yes stop_codon:yes gene_type:complete